MASMKDSKPPYTPEPEYNPTSTPDTRTELITAPGWFIINPDTNEIIVEEVTYNEDMSEEDVKQAFSEAQASLYALFTDSPYCDEDGLRLKIAKDLTEDEWDFLVEKYPEIYIAYYNCEIWLIEMKDGTTIEIER